jgi:hypothetical protein
MANDTIKVLECTRCQAPQVFKPDMMDSEVPVALEIDLNGGYAMFVDNWMNSPVFNYLLCHKCAHEFIRWVGIPDSASKGFHPRTDDSFCNGWTKEEFEEKWIKQINV